jgi:flagellar basal-body rod modification protein FlgD
MDPDAEHRGIQFIKKTTNNIMNVSNITSHAAQTQNHQESAQTDNAKLGKDAFLQLLVAQMKNQDPTNPMDGRKLASQLAQFSSVEQLTNLNTAMDNLVKSQDNMSQSLSNTMAASLAGKEVQAVSDRIHIKAGKDCTIPFQLGSPAADVKITITDSNGTTIRTAKLENLSAGENAWSWNGKTNEGNKVPEGNYAVHIDAKNGDSKVETLVYQQGTAEKVRYTPEGVRLMINGVAVPLGNVKEIGI